MKAIRDPDNISPTEIGHFSWDIQGSGSRPKWLRWVCPHGFLHMTAIDPQTQRLASGGEGNWKWDGNLDSPSLTPSIAEVISPTPIGGCDHGFLTNGEWKWDAGPGAGL